MDRNSANENFSEVLTCLTEKINSESSSFEKFKFLSTFNYVLRNNTLFRFCQEGKYSEAMSYLEKLSPKYNVPRYLSTLVKCGITVTETARSVMLIPKNKGKILTIENDAVGSGKDAVQVAAVQFASIKDKRSYLVDFNEEERRRKIEKHSEGKVKYEDYLMAMKGAVSDRDFKLTEIYDVEGEIDIKPEFDALIKGIHYPDTAQDLYEIFKGTGFGFRIKIVKKRELNFASPGFSVKKEENVYTFTPIVEMEFVKGPENDQLIEYILAYLETNSEIKPGEKIGLCDYDPKKAYKETCKMQPPSYVPDVAIRKEDDTEVQKRLFKGVSETIRSKYVKVKYDFEEHRDNLQINRDAYLLLQDSDFKPPANLRKSITGMKASIRGLSFAELVEQGTEIVEKSTNSISYRQSVLARSTPKNPAVSYADREKQVYMSLFLDILVKSPQQFPKMFQGADGVFRFATDYKDNKVDESEDPYELNKARDVKEKELLQSIEEVSRDSWPSMEQQERDALLGTVGGIPPPAGFGDEKEGEESVTDESINI